MAPALRKMLIGVGVLVAGAAVLVGIAVAALFLVDWNSFRETVAGRASESTGRKVEIRGDLDVVVSWRPQVRAKEFVIANAEWGSKPEMVRADDVYFQILRVLPLLRGRLEIEIRCALSALPCCWSNKRTAPTGSSLPERPKPLS